MPNFDLSKQPKYPVVTFDTDLPITEAILTDLFKQNDGVTLCVRSKNGHVNRGGHFFCIKHQKNGSITLETMEQEYVDTFPAPMMLRFINHACGLKFDSEMQLYCQNCLNFRTD